MFKKTTCLGGYGDGAKEQPGYVEIDPSGRYGRFKEVLGKGAMKTVYRAFDEIVGMEVAWNQVKLNDVFCSPESLQRLYSEVHLLKSLNHDSIIKYHTSWIDVKRRTFNFITEMFTSGTLRGYRQKYQHVDIRAVKNWACQILRGLAYLHSHDPPVIHRDLKCDNIFVNGHLGQVKIGDLGLAAILRGSQHAHSVIGTPEFMAPELYEEDYNELVDVYSFGMCVLEMLTGEYPYSECSNPAQIYKKVTRGKLPEAFSRIQDVEAQRFVGKCLEIVSKRLSAKELLLDPFLASDEGDSLPVSRVPIQNLSPKGTVMEQVPSSAADPARIHDMLITGTMNSDEDTVFLKVQISDNDGHVRNIHFPFNIVSDTSIDVALEMVKELEITDWEPLEIAEMIEEEVASLVPDWTGWGPPRSRIHHTLSFEDDDDDCGGDNRSHHPVYSNSAHSFSQASLPALFETDFRRVDNANSNDICWIQGNFISNGDSSSNCSFHSKFSNVNHYSGNEDDYEPSPIGVGSLGSGTARTRFCPEAKADNHRWNSEASNSWGFHGANGHRRLHKIRSLGDVRSQLLQRSLVELITKRSCLKSAGSAQNLEFLDASGLLDKLSLGSSGGSL